MAPNNLPRFYWNKFKRERETAHARELSLQIINEFDAPKHAHVQAYQLISLCTNNDFDAKHFLEEAFKVLDGLDGHDQLVQQTRDHTSIMLKELEDAWTAKWLEVYGNPQDKLPSWEDIKTYVMEQLIGRDAQLAEEMGALHVASNSFREELGRDGSPGAEEP
ncbi:hypothetical protein LTR36_004756 [Oleoguttula mirabilis]|uniref:Uncharacterized protein n=1 Tax=Oleoguttula mirabilis TaxID=1507867 RepID=A0AAV9JFA6_9PEZI|nr:hypothetical protein LTR36_004756 [Oleoguttula mirabilis]